MRILSGDSNELEGGFNGFDRKTPDSVHIVFVTNKLFL